MFKGAIFTVGLRWADRLIGFVSTLVLARLLMPDDFGVVAMASLVILMADLFLNLGVNIALIQNQETTQEHYDTAWTLRLLQTVFSCVIVSASAPLAAAYFNDPRVALVIQLTSLQLVFNGLENIGIVNFQKEMLFGQDFRFRIFKRLFGFVVTILAAWFLRSYWALVIGTLAGSSFGAVLSYVLHPMRPRLSFARMREIFTVSQWMLVNSIGGYLNNNLHKILVGRVSETSIMGGYSLADEIGIMPAGEILAPINRVLFPAFSAVKHDLNELKRIFLLAQGIQALIAIPASVGLMIVAHEAIYLLLGEKWLFAVPFLEILVLINVVQAITTSGSYVVITLGYFRNAALVSWIQVFFFIALFLAHDMKGAYYIAILRAVSVFIGLFFLLWLVMRALPVLKVSEMVKSVARPLIATLLMYLAVDIFLGSVTYTPVSMLILKVLTGVLVYTVVVLVLWLLAGRPEGAEKYVLGKICPNLNRA